MKSDGQVPTDHLLSDKHSEVVVEKTTRRTSSQAVSRRPDTPLSGLCSVVRRVMTQSRVRNHSAVRDSRKISRAIGYRRYVEAWVTEINLQAMLGLSTWENAIRLAPLLFGANRAGGSPGASEPRSRRRSARRPTRSRWSTR
jgi:hypothetical protein